MTGIRFLVFASIHLLSRKEFKLVSGVSKCILVGVALVKDPRVGVVLVQRGLKVSKRSIKKYMKSNIQDLPYFN